MREEKKSWSTANYYPANLPKLGGILMCLKLIFGRSVYNVLRRAQFASEVLMIRTSGMPNANSGIKWLTLSIKKLLFRTIQKGLKYLMEDKAFQPHKCHIKDYFN